MMDNIRAIFRQERARTCAQQARNFMDLAKSAVREHTRLQYLAMARDAQFEASRNNLLARYYLNALDS